jgi:hypothetical protein
LCGSGLIDNALAASRPGEVFEHANRSSRLLCSALLLERLEFHVFGDRPLLFLERQRPLAWCTIA